MKTTINNVVKRNPAADWELYKGDHFHTDFCESIEPEEVDMDAEMELYWETMTQEEYNNSILANTSEYANFADWYGDAEAKVLCILIKE